jgi:hypothetical protein
MTVVLTGPSFHFGEESRNHVMKGEHFHDGLEITLQL